MPTRNGGSSSNQSLKSDLTSAGFGQAELLGSITQANGAKDKEKENIFRELRAGQSDRMFESVTFPEAVKNLMGKSLAFEQSGYIIQALSLSSREQVLSDDDFEVVTKTMEKQLGLAENLIDFANGNIGYSVITDAGAFPKGGRQNPDKIARLQSASFDMYEAGTKITKAIEDYKEARDMSDTKMLKNPTGTSLFGRASRDLENAMIDFREARNKLTLGG